MTPEAALVFTSDDLWSLLSSERQASLPRTLDEDFYAKLTVTLEQMRTDIDEAKNTKQRRLLEDELRDIEANAKDLMVRRCRKMMTSALSAASDGGKADYRFLLKEERPMLDGFVLALVGFMKQPGYAQAQDMQGGAAHVERVPMQAEQMMEMLGDVGEVVVSPGRVLSLRKGDVVSLPGGVVRVLLDRKLARAIMPGPGS